MDRNLVSRVTAPAVREAIPADDSNPLLASIPSVPCLQEAMAMTEEQYLDVDLTGLSNTEIAARQSASAIITDADRARILINLIGQVRSSYRDRDLRTSDYRNYVHETNTFLHKKRNTQGHEFPSLYGIAPKARARGNIVAMPVRMGRRSFASAIESVIGRGPVVTRVETANGFTEYLQLRTLRMNWPIGGKITGWTQNFIGAFDCAFQTEYAKTTRNPLFRERDSLPAVCALAVVSHLGLLIVERINVEDTRTDAADSTWGAIALFTRMTGIPVLCLPTPGAATLSLSNLSGSVGDLTSAGIVEICPPSKPHDSRWIVICRTQFAATLGVAGIDEMPDWFPGAAYELTLGYPGLLSKVLVGIAQHLISANVRSFDERLFRKYADRILILDQHHIDSIKDIRKGGSYRPSTLIRHGDWLSFGELASTHLKAEIQ
ncbi:MULTISPECIES: hypothetical protein [Burkholderia cepacia complex]|uniref:hypothetical protein n=1 Tax=Burkholderia cepacia complex TaxID=87882 RepID=UPI001E5C3476|nr:MULTISPECIES: hypothetical protein [Burkholderia cepacia complex]